VVEVYMNILSVLHDIECLVFTITIKERIPLRTFRHPFQSGLFCPQENFAFMVRTLFHDGQNPNSMMDKTLFPYWMREV